MVKVDGDILRVGQFMGESKPLHNVAFDGVGQVMYRVGAVGEAKVDDRCCCCIVAGIAPKQIRSMQIIMSP